jgi:peroxiredoxin Q/BCP
MRGRMGFTTRQMVVCLFVALLAACRTVSTLDINQPAPAFTVTDVRGRSLSLADYKGKNLIVLFYIGHTCQPCFQQLGELQKSLAEIRAMGAEVIAIASRDQQDVLKTQQALDLQFVLVPGPQVELMKQYGVYNF